MLRRIQRLLRAGPDRDAQRLPAGENDSAAFAPKLIRYMLEQQLLEDAGGLRYRLRK